jgi:hypothetical protein
MLTASGFATAQPTLITCKSRRVAGWCRRALPRRALVGAFLFHVDFFLIVQQLVGAVFNFTQRPSWPRETRQRAWWVRLDVPGKCRTGRRPRDAVRGPPGGAFSSALGQREYHKQTIAAAPAWDPLVRPGVVTRVWHHDRSSAVNHERIASGRRGSDAGMIVANAGNISATTLVSAAAYRSALQMTVTSRSLPREGGQWRTPHSNVARGKSLLQ